MSKYFTLGAETSLTPFASLNNTIMKIPYYLTLPAVVLIVFCSLSAAGQVKDTPPRHFTLYSESVKDSFTISVNFPHNYNPQKKRKYAVVYLLDANIYFDIVAAALNRYSEIGLAPNVILVGIGYKDFPTLDSLRNRDDTYPKAIAEYEMSVSGGADKFLNFISQELVPKIDQECKTDTAKRVLMGHSLAGYFTAHTLLQTLTGGNQTFSNFIAASPSIHYNRYYLLKKLEQVKAKPAAQKRKAYFTFGGGEDAENADDKTMRKNALVVQQLKAIFSALRNAVIYKSDLFSNLGHMDTQIPTFIRGLQWELTPGK